MHFTVLFSYVFSLNVDTNCTPPPPPPFGCVMFKLYTVVAFILHFCCLINRPLFYKIHAGTWLLRWEELEVHLYVLMFSNQLSITEPCVGLRWDELKSVESIQIIFYFLSMLYIYILTREILCESSVIHVKLRAASPIASLIRGFASNFAPCMITKKLSSWFVILSKNHEFWEMASAKSSFIEKMLK